MEGDHTQPSARGKVVEDGIQTFLQSVQLVVDRDTQRLKRAPRRILVLAPLRRRHGAGHDVGQLQRRLDGGRLAGLHDVAGDLPGIGSSP